MALFGTPPTPPTRLEELKRILQRDPTSRQFLALAEEYRRHGKVRDAIITLERGLSIHTSSVAAHVSLGKAYQQLDRWEDAVRSYQNALKYDRENLVAIRQIAEVYIAMGDKLDALKKLKLYRGLKPGEREVQELIGRLEAELEPRAPERFPSGIRALRADASARTTVAHRPPPARDVAPPAESAPPFDFPPETAWGASDRERTLEAAFAAPPAETPAVSEAGPGFRPAEEVFPSPGPPAPEEPAEPDVPMRVSSTPEIASFVETELRPASGEVTAVHPAEPSPLVETPAPLEEPPAVAAPEPPPPSFESGVRRGPALRDRYEAPAPIEMTPDEVREAPSFRPEAGREAIAFEPPPGPPEPTEPPEPEATAAPAAASEIDKTESPTGPLVTETLAELYRSQGYLSEAREVYLALAASATDPEASRAYARKAEALRVTREHRAVKKRLEGLLTPFPPPPPLATEDLSALLRSIVAEVPGLRAAALTDREGLPVVSEGLRENGESLEVLVAELTSFVKSVGRSGAEIGGGPLRSVAVVGEYGAAVLANVTADYALVLEAEPEAALGEVRWVASRAAERLRPAVG